MAFFDRKQSLERLSRLLELSFSHICVSTFDYHQTSVFPVNVLLTLARDEGKGADWVEIPAANWRAPLQDGWIYFVPCGLEVRFDITSAISSLAFHFNLTYPHGLDVFSGSQSWMARRDPEFAKRLLALVGEETDELKAICALKSEVMGFCLSQWPSDLQRPTPAFRKYESLFRYVREQGDATLSVAALAAKMGRRPDVFSRAFSRDIGESPQPFLRRELLRKLVGKLSSPGMSVKQAADELKFSSQFYLSRFFKKHVGMSPTEYQRRFRR